MILAYYRLLTINSLSLGSLVESLEGLVRDRDGGDDVKDLTDGISFVLELSEEFVEHSLDGIPSGEFSGEVFLSNGEISLSLLSEASVSAMSWMHWARAALLSTILCLASSTVC